MPVLHRAVGLVCQCLSSLFAGYGSRVTVHGTFQFRARNKVRRVCIGKLSRVVVINNQGLCDVVFVNSVFVDKIYHSMHIIKFEEAAFGGDDLSAIMRFHDGHLTVLAHVFAIGKWLWFDITGRKQENQ